MTLESLPIIIILHTYFISVLIMFIFIPDVLNLNRYYSFQNFMGKGILCTKFGSFLNIPEDGQNITTLKH